MIRGPLLRAVGARAGVGLGAQVEALLPVKARYIKAPFPTWTAVGVSDLYDPGAVTEIRLVVRKRG